LLLSTGQQKQMYPKKGQKTMAKSNEKALIVKKVAEKHGVTTAYVYAILAGDRTNEAIFTDYMTLKENIDDVLDNTLINAVNEIIPLPKKSSR
jgi:predicted transcriptional regulator